MERLKSQYNQDALVWISCAQTSQVILPFGKTPGFVYIGLIKKYLSFRDTSKY